MSNEREISFELRDLVSKSVKLLGQALREVYGDEIFGEIEDLRLKMKGVRGKSSEKVFAVMESVFQDLKLEPTENLCKKVKAFSLMLELTNACEAAYRTYRLKDLKIKNVNIPRSLAFVFTSHPTEARSKDFLYVINKLEMLLLGALEDEFETISEKLLYILRIALKVEFANSRRPLVKDEAEQIFHTVLDGPILHEQIALRKKGIDVFFRTWVGGDKDGHPKVGAITMLQSWNLSRKRLVEFVYELTTEFEAETKILKIPSKLQKEIKQFNAALKSLKTVSINDGRKIKVFRHRLDGLLNEASKHFLLSGQLKDIQYLLELYPALVLPLEIREDRELIHEALKKPSLQIAKMLGLLRRVAQGSSPKWYVQGFIISMCQEAADLVAAAQLMKKQCGTLVIPVIPLFENAKGLSSATSIIKKSLALYPFKREYQQWGGRFEIMLGYSDSSKENGVFPGRLMVEKALFDLEEFLQTEGLVPIFFHGSGGSVSRGGGSIKEQIAWLPKSALDFYKVTIQGETVQRHFNQPLIMRSQVNKIVQESVDDRTRPDTTPAIITSFSQEIQIAYKTLLQNSEFQEVTSLATPYDFLNLLKIGSRPAKRAVQGQFSLRAIPWILCWTQTRTLLPYWWGVGSAWKACTADQKDEIRKYFSGSSLMQSYVKNLGFTLAKMELGVWKFQLEHTSLNLDEKKRWFEMIRDEAELANIFFKELTHQDNLTWYNPRLGQSILFRSSMIHPLNVIQKLALERNDHVLLRETVTGIACGMLTTG